jgi:hypothetical protein
MRTTVAILLLVLLTLTQTPLGQLLKLSLLIERFYKHKKQDGVSLLEFLKDHYAKEHNDADQKEDEQLPFKTVLVQNIGFALVPGFVQTGFSLSFDGPKKVILQGSRILQQHLCSIFHPPRV